MADNTQINEFFDLAAFAEQAQIIVNESAKTAKIMREQFADFGKGLNADGLQKYAAAAEKLQTTQRAAKKVLSDYEKAQERLSKSQGDYNRDLERLDELLKAEAQSTAAMAAQNKVLEQIRKNLNTTDKDYAATVQRIIDKQNANIKVMREFQNVEQKRTSGIGKYKEAIEEALQSTGNYRQQLANIKNTMAELEQTIIATKQAHGGESAEVRELQAQYEQLQQRAGQLQDAQSDMQARIRYLADDYANFNAAMEGVKGLTAFGQGIAGVTSLLGVNSKAVERSIQVMMSLQSIMNAVNTVQQIFNKDSRLMVALSQLKAKAATQEKTAMTGAAVATEADAAATTHATVATRAFTTALMHNPFGLIAVALATITTAIIAFTGAMDDATDATEADSRATEKNTELWKDNAAARREALKGTGALLSDIENTGLSTIEREGALLEFVTSKLGVQVNSMAEARKVYSEYIASVNGVTESMRVFTNSGDSYERKYTDLRVAALSLANAQQELADVQERAQSLTQDASDDEKRYLQEQRHRWEASVRYAQEMYNLLERRTIGYYKELKKGGKEAATTQKEVKKATEESTAAQWSQIARSEMLLTKVGSLQRAVMDGSMTLEEYEKQLSEVTYAAQMEEWREAITQLEELNKTLDVNSAEYARNQQEIVKLKRQMNDLTFKKFRDEIKETTEEQKKGVAELFTNYGLQLKLLQAASKKGLEAMLEATGRVMETLHEISDGMNAAISEVAESIYTAQAGRLAKEEAEMAQHYELQRAYIEANVHDEEERQQKLAQLALDAANAKAIAARKEAEVERRKAKVDIAITTAKASADIAAAIAAAVLAAAAAGNTYTLAVRIAAAVTAVLSAGAAVASAAAKIGNIPAYAGGGDPDKGDIFRAGERGYEVGIGRSGRTYLFPHDAVYMAPEPMRIHQHSDSVQMVNNYNKNVTLRNTLTVKVIGNTRIEKYFRL